MATATEATAPAKPLAPALVVIMTLDLFVMGILAFTNSLNTFESKPIFMMGCRKVWYRKYQTSLKKFARD
jgi:hypothetical protein